MKLLFIAESFPSHSNIDLTGGVEAGDYYLCKELAKKHQVTVYTIAREGEITPKTIEGITVIGLGLAVSVEGRQSAIVRLSFLLQAISKARKQEFDLVYSSNVFSSTVAGIISKLTKKPSVAKVADVYLGDWIKFTGLTTGIIGELLERYVLGHKWEAIIAWSNYTAHKIEQHTKLDKIYVIGGGVDKDLYDSLRVHKYPLPTLICVSRLVAYKRVDVVLKAFQLVQKEIPQIQLKIVGIGPELKQLKKLCQELDIERNVSFIGFIPSHKGVVKEIKQSTLFFHASEVEGFGLATLEALACGVPFVHTDLPVTRELTNDGFGGVFFRAGDYHMAADKIVRILSDSAIYKRKILEANKVINSYSWSKVAKETEAVFRSILDTK